MDNSPDMDRIRDYLQTHRNTYTREALRQQLLDNGYDPQAVDLSLAQTYGLQVNSDQPPLPTPSGPKAAFVAASVFFFNYLAAPLVITLMINTGLDNQALLFVLILLVVEIGLAVFLRRRHPAWGRGISWGIMATVLPMVALVLTVGICLAAIGFSY